MEKLYPIIKKAKTSLGRKLDDNDDYAMTLYYCPMCGKRLSGKKVDNNNYFVKRRNLKLKPIYCEGCGSLISPLQTSD